MGAFDLFGWQFLWTAGLALGSSNMRAILARWRVPAWLVILSGAIAAVVFICRHTAFDALSGPALFDVLVDKWKLGVLRLIDFTAIGLLLLRFGPSLAGTKIARHFGPLGRSSLEVFSAHVLFCFFVLGLGHGNDVHFVWWQDALIVSLGLAGLFVVARYAERRRERGKACSLPACRPSVAPSV